MTYLQKKNQKTVIRLFKTIQDYERKLESDSEKEQLEAKDFLHFFRKPWIWIF